jgi:hypothetical protein
MKYLKIGFTGVACLTPAYDGATQEVAGPLYAVLPNSHSARFGSDHETQVDAHFVFAAFHSIHLPKPVKPADKKRRRADYVFRNTATEKDWAVCFFERESLELVPAPVVPDDETKLDHTIRYNLHGNTTEPPAITDTHVNWIPRWDTFAEGGRAAFKAGVLTEPGSYVRLTIPGGDVSAGFVCRYVPRMKFLYKNNEPHYYAHKIVVRLAYPDETETVTLRSKRFDAEPPDRPADLVLTWGTADTIHLTLANASFEEMENVLREDCGKQHLGTRDYEFEIIYDVVRCGRDEQDRRPLPEVLSNETRPVPCMATMVGGR